MTDTGDAFIGYWARVGIGPLILPYAACGLHPAAGTLRHRPTFRASPEPELEGGRLSWTCAPLGVRGEWTPRARALERTLFSSPEGSITWRCHIPVGRARVEVAGAPPLSGLGYVEKLTISVAPSRLPLRELRWGRFLSPGNSLIWIEWRGSAPRRWLFLDDEEMRDGTIADDGVELPSNRGSLELSNAVVLRDGLVASTAFPPIPGLGLLIPRSLRGIRETKWLARGTLRGAGRPSSGWVIHEVVRWS